MKIVAFRGAARNCRRWGHERRKICEVCHIDRGFVV